MIAAIDKLIRSFEREGYKESYFYYLYENRAAAYAALGNFEAAYRDIQHYTELYHKQVNDDNEKTLGEFATLLDVNRLNMEKQNCANRRRKSACTAPNWARSAWRAFSCWPLSSSR